MGHKHPHPAFVTIPRQIYAYRLKVHNAGKSAAENVVGTIEFSDGKERRICWYEGINRASISINRGDHSFLDVYGVSVESNDTICFPNEHGWDEIPFIKVTNNLKLKLRVTSKNASSHQLSLEINPSNDCKPNIL